jgi:hypothetical protein
MPGRRSSAPGTTTWFRDGLLGLDVQRPDLPLERDHGLEVAAQPNGDSVAVPISSAMRASRPVRGSVRLSNYRMSANRWSSRSLSGQREPRQPAPARIVTLSALNGRLVGDARRAAPVNLLSAASLNAIHLQTPNGSGCPAEATPSFLKVEWGGCIPHLAGAACSDVRPVYGVGCRGTLSSLSKHEEDDESWLSELCVSTMAR